MTWWRKWLSAILFGSTLLSSHAAVSQQTELDMRSGKALYERFQCWQCHGYEGQGGRSGPRIADKTYPYSVFSVFVRYTNLMPAYSPSELSDAQLEQIYQFVQSLPAPASLEDVSIVDYE